MTAREKALEGMRQTQALGSGDACEFRFPARKEWQPGTVVDNGAGGYWKVTDEHGRLVTGLYIEHVRAPGTDPWS